ncbi:MAG: photosystem II protein PsbQ [Cyanobacteria bacterium P01_F01_bin.150]
MRQYRSVLSLLLAIVAVFMVSCSSGPSISGDPSYTDADIQLLQTYKANLQQFRGRAEDLESMIADEEWTDIKFLIHGPLGELRSRLSTVTAKLDPVLQESASDLAGDTLRAIVLIDEAAANFNGNAANFQFNRMINDFDEFIDLIPNEATETEEVE